MVTLSVDESGKLRYTLWIALGPRDHYVLRTPCHWFQCLEWLGMALNGFERPCKMLVVVVQHRSSWCRICDTDTRSTHPSVHGRHRLLGLYNQRLLSFPLDRPSAGLPYLGHSATLQGRDQPTQAGTNKSHSVPSAGALPPARSCRCN